MAELLTPHVLLRAYAAGIFPMAEAQDDPTLHWIDPRFRGVFPLSDFHISRSLSQRLRRWNYTIRTNSVFDEVVRACGDRKETWINAPLFALYRALHAMGHAHSLEVWEGDELVGGVFGIALGGAFFGESMFSRRTDASKVALAWLVHRLRAGGFTLFDTQFLTPHLASLGAVEITRAEYRDRLAGALPLAASFTPEGYAPTAQSVSQRKTQTS